MGTLILSFPPPRNWQDFEQLTKQVAMFRLSSDFENYGRQGQSQDGVDIYGWDIESKNTGIQCKHKSHTNSSSTKIITKITNKIIDNELVLADKFTPKLDRFIIATTSFLDTKLQQHVNEINDSRRGKSLVKVELWMWELFEQEINNHSELSYFYFENVLKNYQQYDKDIHTLALLKYSLNRPAFNTKFNSENNCEDFIKAIADTQRAFSTGRLYDRDGNLISSAYPAKTLRNEKDKKNALVIENLLQKIRDFTTENLRTGTIVQQSNFLYFQNNFETKISETLNLDRAKIIETMNEILKRHKIETIDSALKPY